MVLTNQIVNEFQFSGYHSIEWQPGVAEPGVYFYELSSGNEKVRRAMVLY